MREEAFKGDHTEFFQISEGVEIIWSREKQEFLRFDYLGEPLEENLKYSIAFHGYHRNNFDTSFGLHYSEVLENGREFVVASDSQDVLVEYFTDNKPEVCGIEGRLTIV